MECHNFSILLKIIGPAYEVFCSGPVTWGDVTWCYIWDYSEHNFPRMMAGVSGGDGAGAGCTVECTALCWARSVSVRLSARTERETDSAQCGHLRITSWPWLTESAGRGCEGGTAWRVRWGGPWAPRVWSRPSPGAHLSLTSLSLTSRLKKVTDNWMNHQRYSQTSHLVVESLHNLSLAPPGYYLLGTTLINRKIQHCKPDWKVWA